jgi:hypothetical protein
VAARKLAIVGGKSVWDNAPPGTGYFGEILDRPPWRCEIEEERCFAPSAREKERLMKSTIWLGLLVGTIIGVAWAGGPAPAGPASAPKVSTFAPADDLIGRVDYFMNRLEDAVQDEEEYNDSKGRISKDANTMIVIGLALGLHDKDNHYKAAAPAIVKVARALAAAEDYAAAKAGVASLKEAVAGKADVSLELKWEKIASLPELMDQIPLINTKLKRCVKPRRFKKKAKDAAGHAAVIAVIAQGTMANAADTEKPGEVEKWHQFCEQMRDAAAAVNAAVRAGDQEASVAAMKQLGQSCDDCHVVFHEEAESEVQ